MPATSKVCIGAKVLPAIKRDLDRRANRIGMTTSEMLSHIVEGWFRTAPFCDICKIHHPVEVKHLPGKGAL